MNEQSQNPHVVMLNKAYPPWIGGIERHVRDVAEALVHRGWRITVLTCNDKSYEVCECINGVQIIRAPQWMRILSQPIVRGYFQYLKDLKPNLVHAHVPFPLAWRSVTAMPKSVPLVCTWHSDIIRQRFLMPLLAPFQTRFLKRCQRIIVTSEPLLEHSHDLNRCKDRCTVVPLAIPSLGEETEETIQKQVENFQNQYHKPIVLYVGRLVGYKGLPYLLQAMKKIDAYLLIAGEGPLKKSLPSISRCLGVESKVRFLGEISETEKTALYRAAQVTVLPSVTRNEAFGYVLLEAMEQGCPIISTDLPTGTRFVNKHEESGFVVPPEDGKALAESIERIISDENLRKRLSNGARKRVTDVFRFDATIDRIESIYRESLAASGFNE